MAAGRLEATNEATNVKIASVANGTRYPATATKRSYLDNQIPKGGERERERQNERKEEGKKENWHHVPSAAAETRLQWPLWLLIKRVFFYSASVGVCGYLFTGFLPTVDVVGATADRRALAWDGMASWQSPSFRWPGVVCL